MEKNRVDPEREKIQPEAQEGIEMKLLTPLTADLFPEEDPEWEDDPYDSGETLDGMELARYEDAIQKAVDRKNALGGEKGAVCNLIDYYNGSPSIKEKAEQAVVSVENVDGILYGCTTLQIREYLEPEELRELCEYITGQYSDGWGEGFEQRDIRVDGGTLNVHFWQGGPTRFRTRTTEKKQSVPAAEKTCPEKKKPRPKLKLLGHDGNIFSVLSDANRLLSENGMRKEADEMRERVYGAGNYHQALGIISEYVETELSGARDKQGRRKQKTEKGPCR